MNRASRSLRFVWWSLLVLICMPGWSAQPSTDLRVEIMAHGQTRTAPFRVVLGEVLTVELIGHSAGSEPFINIYVHEESGQLVGRDDPERALPAFEWHPHATGRYYLLLENSGTGTAIVRVTTQASKALAQPRRAPASAIKRVYFVTNRAAAETAGGSMFRAEPGDSLTFGYSNVSIPRDHRIGELEGPSILRLEFRANADEHVVLLDASTEPEKLFLSRLKQHLKASRNAQILLFAHGFNVTFEEALRRTAQISYDLAFDGAAITFSWPSVGRATPLAYTRDQRNADVSATSLASVLRTLTNTGATVHVIAHSMGNRVLSGALGRLNGFASDSLRGLGELALLAPDVDSELFKQAAKDIASSAKRVTLYASSQDGALLLAQRVSGYPRAGQAGAGILIIPEVQTIDASAVDTSLVGLNHSYFADNSTLLSDLFNLFRGQAPNERFGLTAVESVQGTYWRFRASVR
jgi:esterase/lipase superfamily enzyme